MTAFNFNDFEVKISAESTETHPKVYTKIHLEFVFVGKDIKEKRDKKKENGQLLFHLALQVTISQLILKILTLHSLPNK